MVLIAKRGLEVGINERTLPFAQTRKELTTLVYIHRICTKLYATATWPKKTVNQSANSISSDRRHGVRREELAASHKLKTGQ